MKKKGLQRPVAVKRGRRSMIILAVTGMVIATAATVISRQNSAAKAAAQAPVTVPNATTATATTAGRTYVTRRVGGQDIQINTQTGQIKPLSPQEAQKLAEGLAPMVDNSSEGLTPVRQADGSISMDLQGHFQSVTVARVNTDGTVQQSCVNNPEAAGKFFGIDPRVIRDTQAKSRTNTNQAPN